MLLCLHLQKIYSSLQTLKRIAIIKEATWLPSIQQMRAVSSQPVFKQLAVDWMHGCRC
jgi:hypothetical protein